MENKTYSYSFKLLRSFESIQEYKDLLKSMVVHLNADIDLYLKVVSSLKKQLYPLTVIVFEKSLPIAALLGRIEYGYFGFHLSYITLFPIKIKRYSIIYQGLLGSINEKNIQIIIESLAAILKEDKIDLIFINQLDIKNTIIKNIENVSKPFLIDMLNNNAHYSLSLPDCIDNFYKTKKAKHRYWLKRIGKIFEEKYPNKVSYRCYTGTNNLTAIFKEIENVAKNTYHRALKTGFKNSTEITSLLTFAAIKQWLRIYILYIEEKPICYWIGRLYKDTFHLDYTGYLPEFEKNEVGTILFLKMIDDLISLKVKTLDYGFGDALYKRRFSTEKWFESSVNIYPYSIKGIIFKIIRTLEKYIDKVLREIFNKFKKIDSIKKRLRNIMKKL